MSVAIYWTKIWEVFGDCLGEVISSTCCGPPRYRPGARFGPGGVRQASRKLRAGGYQPGLGMEPFAQISVVDAGDAAMTPFDIDVALKQAETKVSRRRRRYLLLNLM